MAQDGRARALRRGRLLRRAAPARGRVQRSRAAPPRVHRALEARPAVDRPPPSPEHRRRRATPRGAAGRRPRVGRAIGGADAFDDDPFMAAARRGRGPRRPLRSRYSARLDADSPLPSAEPTPRATPRPSGAPTAKPTARADAAARAAPIAAPDVRPRPSPARRRRSPSAPRGRARCRRTSRRPATARPCRRREGPPRSGGARTRPTPRSCRRFPPRAAALASARRSHGPRALQQRDVSPLSLSTLSASLSRPTTRARASSTTCPRAMGPAIAADGCLPRRPRGFALEGKGRHRVPCAIVPTKCGESGDDGGDDDGQRGERARRRDGVAGRRRRRERARRQVRRRRAFGLSVGAAGDPKHRSASFCLIAGGARPHPASAAQRRRCPRWKYAVRVTAHVRPARPARISASMPLVAARASAVTHACGAHAGRRHRDAQPAVAVGRARRAARRERLSVVFHPAGRSAVAGARRDGARAAPRATPRIVRERVLRGARPRSPHAGNKARAARERVESGRPRNARCAAGDQIALLGRARTQPACRSRRSRHGEYVPAARSARAPARAARGGEAAGGEGGGDARSPDSPARARTRRENRAPAAHAAAAVGGSPGSARTARRPAARAPAQEAEGAATRRMPPSERLQVHALARRRARARRSRGYRGGRRARHRPRHAARASGARGPRSRHRRGRALAAAHAACDSRLEGAARPGRVAAERARRRGQTARRAPGTAAGARGAGAAPRWPAAAQHDGAVARGREGPSARRRVRRARAPARAAVPRAPCGASTGGGAGRRGGRRPRAPAGVVVVVVDLGAGAGRRARRARPRRARAPRGARRGT